MLAFDIPIPFKHGRAGAMLSKRARAQSADQDDRPLVV